MADTSEEKPYSSFVFDKYGTFRNYIRKADLFYSLQAIWAHCNYQQLMKFVLPKYITGVPANYRLSKNKEFLTKMAPWELEIIAKELLIHSPTLGGKKNFCVWSDLAKAVEKLKSLENDIVGKFISKENLLSEVKRISHRQFPWQQIPNRNKMIRYWKIYSKLDTYFYEAYSVSFSHFYTITMSLYGSFTKNFSLKYPPLIELGSINIEIVNQILLFVSQNYLDIQELLRGELSMYHDYTYVYHSLVGYPLIIITYNNQDYIICPLSTFFFNRITDGIYYDLIDKNNPNVDKIKNLIGESFQEYVGEFLTALAGESMQIIPEKRYGGSRNIKDTVDWVVIDNDTNALFVECKAKRMTISAKAELEDSGELEKDLSILADAVKQAYVSLINYQKGNYPPSFPKTKRQYVVISTLEEWYLFGDHLFKKLNSIVKEKLTESKIDLGIMDDSPFFVTSASTIEKLSHILSSHSIDDVFKELAENKKRKMWHIDTYILDKYQDLINQSENPFEEEFNGFIDETIAELRS